MSRMAVRALRWTLPRFLFYLVGMFVSVLLFLLWAVIYTYVLAGHMKHSDFRIGCEFYTATGKWRCTDVGTRTVVAIKLDQEDPHNYNGPPYGIVEHCFDEEDIACADTVMTNDPIP